jgi:hypothetical protein
LADGTGKIDCARSLKFASGFEKQIKQNQNQPWREAVSVKALGALRGFKAQRRLLGGS